MPRGGARKGAGRKPDWFKMHCANLLAKNKYALLKYVDRVANGSEVDVVVTTNGGKVKIPANTRDRLKAFEILADRAFGKPTQAVEMSGDVSIDLIQTVKTARQKRGLE